MKRHPTVLGCLSGSLAPGTGPALTGGDPHRVETGTTYTDTAASKMFAVTTPAGKRHEYEYVHALDPGEKVDNSSARTPPGLSRHARRSAYA